MPVSNPTETIDPRILRLIGLEDVFDLDYETYLLLLKEVMVKSRMTKTTIPTEEIELITDEYKRVKNKKDAGRFKVKKKKITATSFTFGRKKLPGSKETKALPGTGIGISPVSKSLEDNIATITSSVVSIADIMRQQAKIASDSAAYDRRQAENEKRAVAESNLEKRFEGLKKAAEKIIAPVKGVLSKIFDFLTKIFFGRILYKLVEWFSDPKNASKVKSIIRFIGDWWPALLSAYILFGTSFGRFTLGLTKMIGGFIFRIGRVAIPALLRVIARNPVASLVVGGAAAAGIGAYTASQQNEQKREGVKPGQGTPGAPQLQREQVLQRGLGGMFAGGGLANRLFYSASGGKVAGQKGVDKIPAMLSDGEFVMSRGAVQKYGVNTLEAMNASGGGTNRPRLMSGMTFAAGGGMVGGIKNFIKYKMGYDIDKPETWGASFQSSFNQGSTSGRKTNTNIGSLIQGGLNQGQNILKSAADSRSYNRLISGGQRLLNQGIGGFNRVKDKALSALDAPLSALESYGTNRENSLIKSGELKSGDSLTKSTQKRLSDRDAFVKSLYDPKKDKGLLGLLKKTNQEIQNRGLIMDPFAALGLKEEGTEKFIEKMSGGRVKNFGAKITGLQYALKGLAGPLGAAFRIDDRGSLGRYVRPAMLEAQKRGQSGVGAVGLGQTNYNRLLGDKTANLALGQFGFSVDEKGRAKTSDVYDSNKSAAEYFKKSRAALKDGNMVGALFQGLSGVLRINQNTGWGNLRPGGSEIDLGTGFKPNAQIPSQKPKTKPVKPPTKPGPVVIYGKNDPRRSQNGSYKSKFARSGSAVPKFNASTSGFRTKTQTLGLMR